MSSRTPVASEGRCGSSDRGSFPYSHAGRALSASYDEHGFLTLKVDGTSVMDKRTADSADDLVIMQRESNEITIVTDQAARARLLAWEQWL